MKFQASRHQADNQTSYQESKPVPVAFGTDAAGTTWTIAASIRTFGDDRQVSWQWSSGGFGAQFGDDRMIRTVVNSKRTYVLAELPRTIAPTAELQVLRDGLEPVTVPFVDTDPSFDRILAAFAFSEPTPYTAQIVGPDGAVLATWPV
jgi:hypothetical protein